MLTPDAKFLIQVDNGSKDPNIPVLGMLPERFDFDISSDWQTPLAPGAAFGYLGALFRFGLSELGLSAISKWQTVALWSGTAPINVALPMIFIADSPGEAKTKVLDPIKTLMKMALPKDLGGGFLQPPGPKPDGGYASEKLGITGGEDITVRIGKFLTFRKVIIQSVSPSFDLIMDPNGIPMRATAVLRFRTYNSPTKQELDSVFSR